MRNADGSRGISFVAGLLLALTTLSGAARADDALAGAEELLAKGDPSAALERLRPLADDPKQAADPRFEAAYGAALLATGDASAAVAALRAVVRARPGTHDRWMLARALIATARESLASGPRLAVSVVPYLEDALAQARAADPTSDEDRRRFAIVVGEARWLLGDPVKTKEALAGPSLADDAFAQDLLARACYATGDFAAAADAWGRAGNERGRAAAWSAGKDPRAIAAYATLALAHLDDLAVGDEAIRGAAYVDGGAGLDTALAAADVPAERRPAIDRLRGRIAERRGKFADAVARYRAILAAKPRDVDAERDLARALLSLSAEDPAAGDEAIGLFLEVLAARPDDADTRRGLEWQARTDATDAHREWPDRRKLDRAVAIFRALAQTAVAPDDGFAWAQYGNGARMGGDSASAVAAFDKAVEVNPFDGAMWNDRGIALVAAGRRDEALASFEHAISIDSGETAPRQNAARLLRLSGKDDEADAHVAAALRTARAVGGPTALYRSLIDRGIRARRRPELR